MCLNKEISVSIAFLYLLMRYDIVADCTSFAVNQVVKCVKKTVVSSTRKESEKCNVKNGKLSPLRKASKQIFNTNYKLKLALRC